MRVFRLSSKIGSYVKVFITIIACLCLYKIFATEDNNSAEQKLHKKVSLLKSLLYKSNTFISTIKNPKNIKITKIMRKKIVQ